jgi:hypothetical protein
MPGRLLKSVPVARSCSRCAASAVFRCVMSRSMKTKYSTLVDGLFVVFASISSQNAEPSFL